MDAGGSRGIDPYDCSYRDGTRRIDPERGPSDLRNLVEFVNSRAVEQLLNSLHFPATHDEVRRKLGVPEMGAGYS